MPDLQQLSDLVLLAIKAATGPILERLAAAEQHARDLEVRQADTAALRDRVVVLETKAQAAPIATDTAIHFAPLDHVDAIRASLTALRERVAVVEVRALQPGPPGPAGLDGKDGAPDPRLVDDVGALRERVATLEARAPQAGPPGPPGAAGRDGAVGRDGQDGLGFDDLAVGLIGRTLTLTFTKGGTAKTFPIDLPFLEYVGVYRDGGQYAIGDVATYGGSAWHCNTPTTTRPGDGSKDWTLIVKRGRDGKDGVDASIPVVRINGTTTGTGTGG